MPLYEYRAVDVSRSCEKCRDRFEQLEQMSGMRMTTCPRCQTPVRQLLSVPAVRRSESGADDRAQKAGFHKLKKISSGEYEKLY